ncbi:fatty acid synthase-like [Ischnura elegans]|uniref:fatty acid synthase-like n=1 Tax=Ischnura elegans TaxID=197161 RepID=UPI001ED88EC0|nr:fatty acid synthase-like [Ischnura elegans]XP_046403852.1 fatty acid synthase-like [Ischnura elegans]
MPARFPEVEVGGAGELNTQPWTTAPTNGQHNGNALHRFDDEVVISGISARLPESENVSEFAEKLFEGVDLITDDERRWPAGLYGLPTRTGKLRDLSRFDATFFGVHAKQAHVMDPQLRMLLELTHEAIVDAGVNPASVRGSRTGVFVGVSDSESDEFWTADPEQVNGYGLTGCCRAMFPNRISYTFDFSGPSYAIDTACSSSMFALQQALTAIRTGQCDAAIVGGVNLLLKPTCSLQFHRLGMLSPQGACKAFDVSGNGYVRSEAAVVLYLQRASVCLRKYATVINAKTNTDGAKVQGITYPSGAMQGRLVKEVYAEAGIDPKDVVYVEAHGTGTKVGDPQEVNAIADVFCKGRAPGRPLLIGSVKSNMGHSEPASGLCSIAKVLVAMESGTIPANLHFQEPNPDIPALLDGRLKVVSENMPWEGGLVAVNSFGFGGANAHLVLRSNPKQRKPQASTNGQHCELPRLVAVSGRTEEAVKKLLERVEENAKDNEFMALLNEVHSSPIPGHSYRGYTIVGDEPMREIAEFTGGASGGNTGSPDRRPVWWVFSGMGTQWAGMGRDLLMHLPPFASAIRRCANALAPHGLDLFALLDSTQEDTFDSVLHSFVSIAAMQVALVDVLTYLGITPDGIVGHSVGELGCAYADGGFTAEQAVLAAYWRGQCILEANLPPGSMAAVGLTWEEAKARCPKGVFPACHNSKDNVSISGPPELIGEFVKTLTAEKVFAKEVKSSGVAFHSKYIADAGPALRKVLERVISSPKPRTNRWISSSIPEKDWNSPLARLSSPDYHVNNLLSPVLFNEALQHVPDNAIVIEVAPHCLLQAILRRSLPSTCINVGLSKRGHSDNIRFLLSNLGKLYNSGLQPRLSDLYPKVSFPVSKGTPMIAPLIGWDHSTEWSVANFGGKGSGRSGESVISIDLSKEEDAYLAGHTIDGRVLFPATGYLTLVWKTFAKLQGKSFEEFPVVLEEVKFHRATIMPKEGAVKFLVNIFESSGEFELSEGGSVAVSGKIFASEDPDKDALKLSTPKSKIPKEALIPPILPLATNDVYKELRLRGYDYGGIFQGIKESDNEGLMGKLSWIGNWVSFMDTMLQFSILGQTSRELYLPTRIQRVCINPKKHMELVEAMKDENDGLPVSMHRSINVLQAGGVELRGMKASLAPRRHQQGGGQAAPNLEKYTFIPYKVEGKKNKATTAGGSDRIRAESMQVVLQIVSENAGALRLKIAEFVGTDGKSYAPAVYEAYDKEPMLQVDYTAILPEGVEAEESEILERLGVKIVTNASEAPQQGCHLVIGRGKNDIQNMISLSKEGGFLMLETAEDKANLLVEKDWVIASSQPVGAGNAVVLLKKPIELSSVEYVVVNVSNTGSGSVKDFSWVDELKEAMARSEATTGREAEGGSPFRVYVVSHGEEMNGILGLTTCLRQEPGGSNVRSIYVPSKTAAVPPMTNSMATWDKSYIAQLRLDLVSNVFSSETNGATSWGSYRHLKLTAEAGGSVATLQVEHAYINALVRGDLSSLRWIEGPLTYYRPELNPKSELCSVYYAPLNFRDIMLASGKLPPDALPGDLAGQDCILGLEFSGRDSSGRRVMGMVPARGLATSVLADPAFLWEVPTHWTLDQASTVPVVYATSYYALKVRGGMKPGDSVLIHAGTGGVGQAAIAIALHEGCNVFTTVGSAEKRKFLLDRFPKLNARNIGNSRDTSFEQMILEETEGRGVDLVLNSLAEEKLQASIRCLAQGGRFLEIGKFDLSNNNALGMSVFLKNTTFHGILLDALFGDVGGEDKKEVVRLVSEGIKSGAVKPLPCSVYSEAQVEQAFRFIGSGKHIGKVVLKIRNEEPEKGPVKACHKLVQAIPRTYMNNEKVYILVGGLGGFGLELADWLITRGAAHLVLTSRSGVRTGYQSLCLRRWRQAGINVRVSTEDVSSLQSAERLLKFAAQEGPVGGIFHLAAVLKDAFMENQSAADFAAVWAPKARGLQYLDEASRTHCPQLDHFVAFSSVSCGRGNAGQANYGLANSACERLVEARQAQGLPGLAIQWGAVGDVGMVAEAMAGSAAVGANEIVVGGTLPQRMTSCLAAFDTFLQRPDPVLASLVVAEKGGGSQSDGKVSLVDAVANILGIKDASTVSATATLADLGMDSIMGAEIKQTLERTYDHVLSAQEIRAMTFGQLRALESGGAAPTSTPAKKLSVSLSGKAAAAISASISKDIAVNGGGLNGSDFDHLRRSREGSPLQNEVQFDPTQPLMPTEVLVQLQSENEKIKSTAKPLFVVHPIEGLATALIPVAKELNCPVWGLQCTADAPLTTIKDLAGFYIKHMKKVCPKGPYRLCGYSFGACVAFEMALQLESAKEEVAGLALIDGSPSYVARHTGSHRARHIKARRAANSTRAKMDETAAKAITVEEEADALTYFVQQFRDLDYQKTKAELQSAPTWESRLKKATSFLRGCVPAEFETDLSNAAESFYRKLLAADAYSPSGRVKGPVQLLRAEHNYVTLGDDYGLTPICEQKVGIHALNGNHRQIVQGEYAKKVANILTRVLQL